MKIFIFYKKNTIKFYNIHLFILYIYLLFIYLFIHLFIHLFIIYLFTFILTSFYINLKKH